MVALEQLNPLGWVRTLLPGRLGYRGGPNDGDRWPARATRCNERAPKVRAYLLDVEKLVDPLVARHEPYSLSMDPEVKRLDVRRIGHRNEGRYDGLVVQAMLFTAAVGVGHDGVARLWSNYTSQDTHPTAAPTAPQRRYTMTCRGEVGFVFTHTLHMINNTHTLITHNSHILDGY